MKILHLTLKRKRFDMIASGEKKEEYREIKPYWEKRLIGQNGIWAFIRDFDVVRFKNGYAKDAQTMDIECSGVFILEGKPEWGAEPGKKYFVIKLGKVLTITK